MMLLLIFIYSKGTFCFACSQVWSEHQMQTTSWDLWLAVSLRERTSQHPPATSHTSSTRATGTPKPSGEVMNLACFREDQQSHLITSHSILSPRDPQTHGRRPPPPTQFMKIERGVSKNIPVAFQVMIRSIMAMAITTTTTDKGRSRGSTSAGDGRNVCKGNFSY